MLVAGGFGLPAFLGRLFPDSVSPLLEGVDLSRNLIIGNALIRLAIGCALIWLYAAARFRLRSTFRTAVRVGLTVWFLSYIPLVWALYVLEILPRRPLAAMAVWGLMETLLAALTGGWLHQLTKPDDARY